MQNPLANKKELEDNLVQSLQSIKADRFELLLESMPPFPWFFGGQWFSGFFGDSKEIAAFSKKTGYPSRIN